jgi:hypothetical protein
VGRSINSRVGGDGSASDLDRGGGRGLGNSLGGGRGLFDLGLLNGGSEGGGGKGVSLLGLYLSSYSAFNHTTQEAYLGGLDLWLLGGLLLGSKELG